MVAWLAVAARAAPVVCDPAEAARIVDEARIAPARVPVTHPHLVPGLALGGGAPAELREVLGRLCAPGVTVSRGPTWEGRDAAAYVLEVSRAVREGCWLVQHRASVSVGRGPAGVVYDLLHEPPADRTALAGCEGPSVWHERREWAGDPGPVRLVRQDEHRGSTVLRSTIEVMTASARGWERQVLMEPAPASGVYLASVGSDWWVVACRRGEGQTVWRPSSEGYTPTQGRQALGLLARAGWWRLAGTDGWFLVLTQDRERAEALVAARLRRLSRRQRETLHLYRSSMFPGLNPGHAFVAQDPWPTREEAEAARRGRRGPYVKRGWTGTCAP